MNARQSRIRIFKEAMERHGSGEPCDIWFSMRCSDFCLVRGGSETTVDFGLSLMNKGEGPPVEDTESCRSFRFAATDEILDAADVCRQIRSWGLSWGISVDVVDDELRQISFEMALVTGGYC